MSASLNSDCSGEIMPFRVGFSEVIPGLDDGLLSGKKGYDVLRCFESKNDVNPDRQWQFMMYNESIVRVLKYRLILLKRLQIAGHSRINKSALNLIWEQEVEGSNPFAPIRLKP